MTSTDVAQAIYLVSKDKKGAELSSSLDKVTKFLARKRLISRVPEILESLESIINKAEGRVVVNVTSAIKLNEEMKKEISHLLKRYYGAKEFILIENIDASLLGGIRIELNNEIIDLSIKNKIGQLQAYLQKN